MRVQKTIILATLISLLLALQPGVAFAGLPGSDSISSSSLRDQQAGSFSFAVAADARFYTGENYNTSQYFRGVVEKIATLGGTSLMISPGDMDPLPDAQWTIDQYLGVDYPWYPVVGNHELPGDGEESSLGANMAWLRSYNPGPRNPGPSGCPTTTYSFDYANAHFVILNVFCDASGDTVTDGDIPDHLYNWLVDDLNATQMEHIFIVGHEPAFTQPDQDNGRERHMGEGLEAHPANRDRFWNLLQDHEVVAYIVGHTHNYSAVQVEGVWQIDAGHARGLGDTGARSTFVLIHVNGSTVAFETYRDNAAGGAYTLLHSGTLESTSAPVLNEQIYLPLLSASG